MIDLIAVACVVLTLAYVWWFRAEILTVVRPLRHTAVMVSGGVVWCLDTAQLFLVCLLLFAAAAMAFTVALSSAAPINQESE